MRSCFILLMLCFHLSIFSQSKPDLSELSIQINKFISDSSNNFLSYKGSVKEIIGDTIYFSSLHLTGASTTSIWVDRDGRNFVSVDIDTMLTKKEASSLVTKWKNYLKKILPESYKIEPFSNSSPLLGSSAGYTFNSANIHITLYYNSFTMITNELKNKKNYELTKKEGYNVILLIGKK